jgi:ATP-dependent Clp protease ATP-binding subunit ClpA
VFHRFDERADRALTLAGLEARERRFSHVGTESLLIGLLLEAEAPIDGLGSSSPLVERVRAAVGARVSSRDERDPEPRVIDLTPRARQVLTQAAREAADDGVALVAPRHVLLAMSRVGEGEGLIALETLRISVDELCGRLYG